PDLSVADLAGPRRGSDEVDDLVGVGGLDQDLELHLRDEVDLVLRPPEGLGLAALTAVPLDLAHGEAEDAGPPQGLLHLLQLEGLDDGGDEIRHDEPPARPALRCWTR